MTVEEFRAIVLACEDVVEAAHMGHPDFRLRGRIFATIPDGRSGMVKLSPHDQAALIAVAPDVFEPIAGGWGANGATRVRLEHAGDSLVREAVALAHQLSAAKYARTGKRAPAAKRTRGR